MPKSKEANELIRNEKKACIFNTAIEVFAEKGYIAANMEDIARRANISVGLIYRYFSSKAVLYSEIVDFAIMRLNEFTEMLNSEQSPRDTIKHLAEIILGEMHSKLFIDLNLMMVQGSSTSDPPRYNEVLEHNRKMIEFGANLIKKGQQQGVFKSGDPRAKSIYFFSSVMGLMVSRAVYNNEYPLPTVNDMLAYLIKE
jgi:AcrR family transcriptional regulator